MTLPELSKGLLCIAACMLAASPATAADTVYRCGAASSPIYTKEPCVGGKAVEVGDPRSAKQKAHADAATREQAKTAERMEKDRLAQEAAWAKANKPPAAAKTAKAPRTKASAPKNKSASKGEEKLPVYIPFKPVPKGP